MDHQQIIKSLNRVGFTNITVDEKNEEIQAKTKSLFKLFLFTCSLIWNRGLKNLKKNELGTLVITDSITWKNV